MDNASDLYNFQLCATYVKGHLQKMYRSYSAGIVQSSYVKTDIQEMHLTLNSSQSHSIFLIC